MYLEVNLIKPSTKKLLRILCFSSRNKRNAAGSLNRGTEHIEVTVELSQ